MLQHAFRDNPVANALPGAPKPEVIAGHKTTLDAMKHLKATIAAAKEKGGRQGFTKASTPCLDILVTTSHEDMQKMSKQAQDKYFKDALKFIESNFGGSENILAAAVHRDETTAHMQVLVMPFDRTKNRFTASAMIGGPAGLSALQDGFWEACGKPRGLLRGEKGSKSEHVPVRKLYAAMNAGAEAPAFVTVPPKPGLLDRLKSDYAAKVQERENALKHNAQVKKNLLLQAKTGRMMHPEMIAREAEKYRKAVTEASMLKAAKAENAMSLVEAKKLNLDTSAKLVHVVQVEAETRLLAQSADAIWTKSGAQIVDKMTKHFDVDTIKKLEKSLGINLIPGKPLIDQMRKQGIGSNLINCVKILDGALDNSMSNYIKDNQLVQREK
jgi:hypothetical protein